MLARTTIRAMAIAAVGAALSLPLSAGAVGVSFSSPSGSSFEQSGQTFSILAGAPAGTLLLTLDEGIEYSEYLKLVVDLTPKSGSNATFEPPFHVVTATFEGSPGLPWTANGYSWDAANGITYRLFADLYSFDPGIEGGISVPAGTALGTLSLGFDHDTPMPLGFAVLATLFSWEDGLASEDESAARRLDNRPVSGGLPLTEIEVLAVPEPATGTLLLAGAIVLGALVRRRLPRRHAEGAIP